MASPTFPFYGVTMASKNDAKEVNKNDDLPIPLLGVPDDSSDKLIELLSNMSDDKKSLLIKALGASPITKPALRRKKRVTEEEVKNLALATGGATQPEGFLPVPPEHIVEMGEDAVYAYHQQWLDGNLQSWDNKSQDDLKEMIATARM